VLGSNTRPPAEDPSSDVDAVLESLRGHRRYNAIMALRSLFRFAKRRGLTFALPCWPGSDTGVPPGRTPPTGTS